MKKSLRILSLALAVLLACSITVTACADTCYDVVKQLLTESDSSLYLGSGTSAPSGGDGMYTMVWYDVQDNTVVIVTKDKMTWFENVDFGTGLYTIYELCGVWDSLAGCLDSGYSLVLGIANGDFSDGMWMTSADDAAAFRTVIESTLNE